MTDSQKSESLDLMGKISCAITGDLEYMPSDMVGQNTTLCQTCDLEQDQHPTNLEKDATEFEELWKMFNAILPKLTRTPGPRIAAMIALRRMLMHSPCLDQLHISTSASGEFCLHSLRSSIRELRVVTRFDFPPWTSLSRQY